MWGAFSWLPPCVAVGGAGELQHVLVYGGFDGEAVTGDLILIDPSEMGFHK